MMSKEILFRFSNGCYNYVIWCLSHHVKGPIDNILIFFYKGQLCPV